jgi:hypothetical protein
LLSQLRTSSAFLHATGAVHEYNRVLHLLPSLVPKVSGADVVPSPDDADAVEDKLVVELVSMPNHQAVVAQQVSPTHQLQP